MTERRISSRALIGIAIAAAIAVVAIVAVSVSTAPGKPPATLRPIPSASPTVTTPPSASPSIIPATCEEIYTRDWAAELDPIVLNPAWTREANTSDRSNDVELKQLLTPSTRLTCQWGKPVGGSDVGLITSLALIDAATESTVKARFNTLGWTCFDVAAGVRCVTEAQDENGSWGESHFVRDGVWVATRWSNLAPDGYTADIIATLWP